MNKFVLLTILTCYGFILSCQNKNVLIETTNYNPPYHFEEPSKKYKLPKSLKEVSGIAYIDSNKLLAIQDEKGILYTYDLEKKEVTDKMFFGAQKDYEGLCLYKDKISIINSSGELYQMTYNNENNIHLERLKQKGEIEGITALNQKEF